MELHRLKPMKEGYSEELFNKIYSETKPLRKKLASQIDCRRYNVTRDIVESWFDDKFILVFNKYFESKDPDLLKGYIISSLQVFKYRILRKAYNIEGQFHSNIIDLGENNELMNVIPDKKEVNNRDLFYNLAMAFMKEKLSDNAFMVFQLQIDPPPYILSRIKNCNSRISNELISDYLGLSFNSDTERYIKRLKKDINKTIKSAKEYFSERYSLALSK